MKISTLHKYKSVDHYYKKGLGISLLAPKSVTLEKLETAKLILQRESMGELRLLKNDANALSDWIKTISVLFTVLGLIFTLTTGVITSTNQKFDDIDNALTDFVRDMSIRQIDIEDNLDLQKEKINKVYDLATNLKRDRVLRTYYINSIMYLLFIVLLLVCLTYFNYIAKKSFVLSNLINDVVEELNEKQLLERERVKEKEALDKELRGNILKEKNRIAELRQNRLDRKYKKL